MIAALQWSGALLVCGSFGLGLAIVLVSLRPVVDRPLPVGVAALLLVAAALLLVSLPGMYAAQADAAGAPGLVGHALLATGLLLLVVESSTPLLHPSIKEASGETLVAFALGIALTFGLLLTGIATLQAGVFPRPAAVLLLAATAGFFFVFFVAEFLPPRAGQLGNAVFGVALALAFAWIGLSLWTRIPR